MAEEITKQEWGDWKASKTTKEFLRRLFEKRELLKEGLAEGQADNMAYTNIIIGQCQAYKDMLTYAIETFEVLDPEESE